MRVFTSIFSSRCEEHDEYLQFSNTSPDLSLFQIELEPTLICEENSSQICLLRKMMWSEIDSRLLLKSVRDWRILGEQYLKANRFLVLHTVDSDIRRSGKMSWSSFLTWRQEDLRWSLVKSETNEICGSLRILGLPFDLIGEILFSSEIFRFQTRPAFMPNPTCWEISLRDYPFERSWAIRILWLSEDVEDFGWQTRTGEGCLFSVENSEGEDMSQNNPKIGAIKRNAGSRLGRSKCALDQENRFRYTLGMADSFWLFRGMLETRVRSKLTKKL